MNYESIIKAAGHPNQYTVIKTRRHSVYITTNENPSTVLAFYGLEPIMEAVKDENIDEIEVSTLGDAYDIFLMLIESPKKYWVVDNSNACVAPYLAIIEVPTDICRSHLHNGVFLDICENNMIFCFDLLDGSTAKYPIARPEARLLCAVPTLQDAKELVAHRALENLKAAVREMDVDFGIKRAKQTMSNYELISKALEDVSEDTPKMISLEEAVCKKMEEQNETD